jgi:SAM-dependent methyltransferase
MKSYDRAYFDRWYRDPTDRVATRETLARKVHMAVGLAEYLLDQRITNVLDVGCGEAPWLPALKRIRRDIRYVGVDSSDYVVARFGKSRHIRRGSLGELHKLALRGPFDLIVCADVLQYVDTKDVERGLKTTLHPCRPHPVRAVLLHRPRRARRAQRVRALLNR